MTKRICFFLILIFTISKFCNAQASLELYVSPIDKNIVTYQQAFDNKEWEKTSLPFFKLNTNTHFIKFRVPGSAVKRILVIENPVLDTLEIKVFSEGSSPFAIDKELEHYLVGKTMPFSKARYSRNVLPNFSVPASEKGIVFYIKTQSNTQTTVPIRLVSVNLFPELIGNVNTIAGIYFGILLVMLLYNLFIWFSVKEETYVYYCLYILALAITQFILQGYAKKLIGPNSINFNLHAVVWSGSILGIATIVFARSFLKTKKYIPIMDKVLQAIIVFCFASIVFDLLGFYSFAFNHINLVIGLGSLYLLIASIFVYKKKYHPALYFVVAFAILLIGTIIFVMKDYGTIPHNNFSIYGYQLGSLLQVILLSFALADKINTLKKEKEEEQQQKLQALEKNKEIILSQNEVLETTVNEKTKELVNSNLELTTTLINLKNAQVSLVESEKMASLGQLTAGVAHEINNPINFVSSNVKPLIRDFEDIREFMNAFKGQHKSDEGVNGEELIKIYRKLDLDYTLEEVGQLLSGVQEGANRTAEIVKGLKNFSRLDEAEFKTASLEEGLDSTLILLRSNLKGQIKIVKDYGGVPPIDCFAGKLNQVFMNLINNAIYAIFNNPEKPNDADGIITLTTKDFEDKIVVIIQDNGSGMDEKTLNKLFEPFFTTKPVGEGTGLGMSITYNIINDLHKGKLEIESKLNVGTKISIFLPKNLTK